MFVYSKDGQLHGRKAKVQLHLDRDRLGLISVSKMKGTLITRSGQVTEKARGFLPPSVVAAAVTPFVLTVTRSFSEPAAGMEPDASTP
ncbi:hypothetical protein NPIL_530361 [Nephila pilipes]|uniref:Uncharacterized protein n=1 Tax=Nephila pilipes TaxID=299642 RepID=A0A8X6T4K3_NEPPI|nr:hypothetical protein NPIL_530361 [Nephila pilipes]